MRFLVDECTGPAVAKWLREHGYEVFSVYEDQRGLSDDAILEKAYRENWVILTNDKDFGEKVFQDRYTHQAKQHGFITSIRPILDEMILKGRWYRQSVYHFFLQQIGE